MTPTPPRRLTIGISGASGIVYGIRLLQILRNTPFETHLVISRAVIAHPGSASGWAGSFVASTKRRTSSTEALFAFAVLTRDRQAA